MKEAPLWRFALRLWRDKRIERVCLRLQDEHGVPVAVLLTALWLSDAGRIRPWAVDCWPTRNSSRPTICGRCARCAAARRTGRARWS